MVIRPKGARVVRAVSLGPDGVPVSCVSRMRTSSRTEHQKRSSSSSISHATDPWANIFDGLPQTSPNWSRRLPRSFFQPNSFFPSGGLYGPKFFTPNPSTRRRNYSTQASPLSKEWDLFFDEIESKPSPSTSRSQTHPDTPLVSAIHKPDGRSSMSAAELSVFDDMFNMIFHAVNTPTAPEQSFTASRRTKPKKSQEFVEEVELSAVQASRPERQASVAPTSSHPPIAEFGRMRRQSNKMFRASETDEQIDQLKEQVELCKTDLDMLYWAKDNLFPKPTSSSPPSKTYPHLLAHIMHIFRTKYENPHTALALFSYAKRLSITSYVFGCTTPAYNELLQASWDIDRDVRSVEDILLEMRANAVAVDGKTRSLFERIRREVGKMVMQDREQGGGESILITGEEDPWQVLARVEDLVTPRPPRPERSEGTRPKSKLEARKQHWREEWKQEEHKIGDDDRLTLL